MLSGYHKPIIIREIDCGIREHVFSIFLYENVQSVLFKYYIILFRVFDYVHSQRRTSATCNGKYPYAMVSEFPFVEKFLAFPDRRVCEI